MTNRKRQISLGFSSQFFEAGAHICQIFTSDEERQNSLVEYLISGLKTEEKTACFSAKETQKSLEELFQHNGFMLDEIKETKAFSLSKTSDVYFENGSFEPERMLQLIKSFYEDSCCENFSGARVIGEMTPEIEYIPGGSRLLEYESKISLLLKTHPVTSVCQYDAREFDGATIMDVLKVHPYMIVRGSVVSNPFFIEPEEYLAKHCQA